MLPPCPVSPEALEKHQQWTIISTGEDTPRGQSLRARLLVRELGPGDLGWAALTLAQADAGAGLYAAALAGYLQWLAPNHFQHSPGVGDEKGHLARQTAQSWPARPNPGYRGRPAPGGGFFS
jgi:hypothetical protein